MADKKVPGGDPAAVRESATQLQNHRGECPGCGARVRLYGTPRDLRCAECVKMMDSAGLGFR